MNFELITLIFFFLLGTVVGSFLNVWSRRLMRDEPVTGRSHCENCGHVLAPYDLIPLLSFLLLRGRCRYCHKPLSWQYPIVELATGILFAALELKLGFPSTGYGLLAAGFLLIASCALIVVFLTDFLAQKIFDQVIFVGLVSAFFYRGLVSNNFLGDLLGAILAYLFFRLIRALTSGRGLGDGDPPLEFFAALLVGAPLVLAQLFLAFILGSVVGVILVAFEKKHLSDRIAFGPFLVASTFVTIFAGGYIWTWYLSQLGF